MRHARVLTRYAVASVAILIASVLAVAVTARVPRAAEGTTAPAAPRTGLSETARLAYWRAGADGRAELWVGDLDGRRTWTVATVNDGAQVAQTRWSPDGSAVAYVEGGGTVVSAARVDEIGLMTAPLPPALLSSGWKVVGIEWSTDGKRIAATFRSGNGIGNDSDVYVVDTKGGGWERITSIGDAFAAPWIDDERMLIETSGGMIAVLDLATRDVRPITGMPAASPLVGRDGRLYFVGGRYVRTDVSPKPYANGWVWSATVDGDDVRREGTVALDQMRLFGVLADGRAAVGVPGAVYLAHDDRIVLSFRGGTVRSVEISDDGRRLAGWTGSRVLLIDPSKVAGTLGTLPSDDAARVVIDGLADADVWYPHQVPELAHAPAPDTDAPRARLAYQLGRSVWERGPDGTTRLVVSAPQYFASPPQWSPEGDRLAVVVAPSGGIPGIAPPHGTAVVAGPRGTVRWEAPGSYPTFAWSLDGRSLVFSVGGGIVDRGAGPEPAPWTTELRDADTGTLREKLDGRVIFCRGARVRLSDGDWKPEGRQLLDQHVEVPGAGEPRVLTTASTLASQVLASHPAAAQIAQVVCLGDPGYVGMWVWNASSGVRNDGAFVVLRIADGRIASTLPYSDARSYRYDLSASPARAYIAWTEPGSGEPTLVGSVLDGNAHVADLVSGTQVDLGRGRFAGWSPDPDWAYVARPDGLYAARVDGSRMVRVGPIGVTVAAAKP